MPEETLPIYQIPDFETEKINPSEFYYSELEVHLKTHLFIQKPHKHDFYIVLLITGGTGTHTIDFRNYQVKPGTAFFLSPGQVHSWQLSEDTKGHVLFFSGSFYSAFYTQKKLMSFTFFRANISMPFMILSQHERDELLFYFERIHGEFQNPGWSSHTQLASYTNLLLTNSFRYYLTKNRNALQPGKEHDLFQKLEILIESGFLDHREVGFYAQKMHLSLKQLNSLTKNSVGKTVSQLIMDRVILESKRLLTNSSKTVSEIASYLRFDDPSYFSRLFKSKTTCTPEQFRKEIRS
ncbi:helix-turn-helix domain-containing protein [Algoriphagus aestuarii]|nr:helix-turn-helix domain-containing protein [Algoriphagus aestuarii]